MIKEKIDMKRWIITGLIGLLLLIIGYLFYINRDYGTVTQTFEGELIDLNPPTIEELYRFSPESLKEIKKLDITFPDLCPPGTKGYDTFPSIVSKLINLEELYCMGNEISDLSPIMHLIHLQKIYLRDNNVSDWKGFENLTNLIYLDISYNELSDLEGIEKLENLQSLNLFGNRNLSNLKGIETLRNLKELSIGHNNLESFPPELLHLKNLKSLSLEGLYFESFPDSFYTVSLPIESLYIRNMYNFDYDSNLPKFHQLKNLRELYIGGNNIAKLNIDFEKCEKLESFIYGSHEKIDVTDILTRISKSPKLKYLGLSDNSIQYLPKDIVLPDSLEELNLSYNNIKKLPIKIAEYTNLKKVDLRNNPIDTMAIKKIEKEMVNTKFYYDK